MKYFSLHTALFCFQAYDHINATNARKLSHSAVLSSPTVRRFMRRSTTTSSNRDEANSMYVSSVEPSLMIRRSISITSRQADRHWFPMVLNKNLPKLHRFIIVYLKNRSLIFFHCLRSQMAILSSKSLKSENLKIMREACNRSRIQHNQTSYPDRISRFQPKPFSHRGQPGALVLWHVEGSGEQNNRSLKNIPNVPSTSFVLFAPLPTIEEPGRLATPSYLLGIILTTYRILLFNFRISIQPVLPCRNAMTKGNLNSMRISCHGYYKTSDSKMLRSQISVQQINETELF